MRPDVAASSVGVVTGVLTACIGTVGANSLALGPIAPEVSRALGADTVGVMHAGSSYALGTAVGALCLSPLVDRIGTRRSLLGALLALVAAFAASALSPNVASLVIAQGVAGLLAGLALPAIYAFAALIAPPGEESRVLGRVLVGWTLSLVAGVTLSTVIADVADWRLVYGAFAMLTLAALVALGRVRVGSDGSAAYGERPASGVTWPLSTVRIPGVAPRLLLCFGFMLAFYGVYGYVGDHVVRALERPLRTTGLVTLSYGAGFGIAAIGDRIIDRVGATRATPWAFALVVLVYVALALGASDIAVLVACAFAWGFANHFGLNLIVAGLSAIDPARRGAILGGYSATTYLAASVGTFAFGRLYAGHGFATLAWIAAATVAIVATASVAALRRPARIPGGVP